MKAETIIVKARKLSEWKENAEENYITTPISVLKYITILEDAKQEYARIQIEKDRERIKQSFDGFADLVIDNVPITLD